MKNWSVRELTYTALLTALVAVATLIRLEPFPAYKLYFNLGEIVIYTAALLLGRRVGALSGAVGSAIADLIAGFPMWAPISFVIKGVEGYLVGTLADPEGKSLAGDLRGLLPGAAWMIAAYATTAGILFGVGAVPFELVIDGLQTGVGVIGALALVRALRPLTRSVRREFEVRPSDGSSGSDEGD